MANLLNVKLQEIHEGKRDYLRYKGRDGRYHFLDTKEMPDSDTNSVTYGQLVEMRQAALLEPGMLYRITDYATTTVQENTRSAGNQFDIVVMALDSKTLAERAWAMPHSGDTYFAASNLKAWRLLYSLENDTKRFAWADPVNGKGVIYRMIDEHNNDCPYDFKNIQFKRWAITALTSGSDEMKAALIYDADENPVYFGAKAYGSPVINGATLDDDNYIFAYTFDGALKDAEGNITHYDVSAAPFVGPQEFIDYMIEQEMGEGIADFCYDNFIGNYGEMDIEGDNLAPGLTLPNNVFFNSSYCYFDEDEDYWSYAFANCYGNSLKSYCSNNTFGNNCGSNTFGNYCTDSTFGNSFYANTFGNSCQNNTFGNDCGNNTFGNGCGNNTFGNNCYNNTFGNMFQSNTFGNGCGGNTFGNSCQNNTFGNYCSTNTFGNNCARNTFGNGCQFNTFGNNAEKCSVGDGVQNITVSKDFMRYVIIENGNQKITITSNKTTSSSAYLQNFLIALGVNNSNNTKTISHNSVGDAFRTVYQNENSTSVDV